VGAGTKLVKIQWRPGGDGWVFTRDRDMFVTINIHN